MIELLNVMSMKKVYLVEVSPPCSIIDNTESPHPDLPQLYSL